MKSNQVLALVVSVLIVAACSDTADTSGNGGASVPTAVSTSPTASPAPSSVSVASPDPTSPAFDPRDSEWVIQPDATIVVIGPDGVGSFPLATEFDDDQNNPDWSPDGSQLTFTVRDDLWVVGVDGTDAREILECESPCVYVDDPAWSPDGTSIVACTLTETESGASGSLVAVDVETGVESTVMTFAPEDFCAGPRWSPDGTEIVLEIVHRSGTALADDAVGVSLTILDVSVDPPTTRAVTDPALFAATADWSPTDDLIVYSALPTADATTPDLFTMGPDGSDPVRLTTLADEGGSAVQPAFDLDGESVVFVDEVQGSLLRVSIDTGAVTPAFSNVVFGDHPRRRPSG